MLANSPHDNFVDSLKKDPEKLKAFLRQIMGPPTKTLEGKEKEQILLLLEFLEPFKTTNNQRSWTQYYMIGETEYHVTDFEDEIMVEEMLKE
jgi:hypothetical protein